MRTALMLNFSETLGAALGSVLGVLLLYWLIGLRTRRRSRVLTRPVASQDVLDVTPLAQVTRRLARRARECQAAGLSITLVSLFALIWVPAAAFVLVGPVVALAGTAYYRRRSGNLSASTYTGRWSRRVGALALGIMSYLCGCIGLISLAYAGVSSATYRPGDRLVTSSGEVIGTDSLRAVATFTGLVAGIFAVLLYRWARRLAQGEVRDAVDADRRSPVPYLRSFKDDRTRITSSASIGRSAIEAFSPRPTQRFEEALARTLGTYGPVVAISDPESRSRPLGAARAAFPAHTDEWRSQILRWVAEAPIVIVSAGLTPGLAWEIEQTTTHAVGKTIYIVSPGTEEELSERVNHLYALLNLPANRQPPANPAGILALVLCADGSLRVVTADRRDEAGYQHAIHAGVALLQGHQDENRRPAAWRGSRGADRFVGVLCMLIAAVCIFCVSTFASAGAGSSLATLRVEAEANVRATMLRFGADERQAACTAAGFAGRLDESSISSMGSDTITGRALNLEYMIEAAGTCDVPLRKVFEDGVRAALIRAGVASEQADCAVDGIVHTFDDRDLSLLLVGDQTSWKLFAQCGLDGNIFGRLATG
jgi:hypothetical protein